MRLAVGDSAVVTLVPFDTPVGPPPVASFHVVFGQRLPPWIPRVPQHLHHWVAECTNVPKEVADNALAHRIANAVEAAYRRTDFFERRPMLMNGWAEFLLI